MFIGHLPAGYLLTKKIQSALKTNHFLWVGLLASILPDVDLVYFYFVDHAQSLHHGYWTHIPFYWLMMFCVALLATSFLKEKNYRNLVLIFFANIFMHLFLDTIVGKVQWFYPFSNVDVYFFEVPAAHGWWVLNFIFHWTFLFEIGLVSWAMINSCRRLNKNTAQ